MELNALLLIGLLLLMLYLDNWGAGGVTSTERRVAVKLMVACDDQVYGVVCLALELQRQRIEPHDVDCENGADAVHAVAATIRVRDAFRLLSRLHDPHEVDAWPEFQQLDYAWKRCACNERRADAASTRTGRMTLCCAFRHLQFDRSTRMIRCGACGGDIMSEHEAVARGLTLIGPLDKFLPATQDEAHDASTVNAQARRERPAPLPRMWLLRVKARRATSPRRTT